MNDLRDTDIDTGLSAGKDVPPWLQPVPVEDTSASNITSNRMLIATILGTIFIVSLFVAVIWFFYGSAPARAPIHVAAPTTPIKEKPTNPGGMKVDHQDKTIFDQSDGIQPRGEVVLGPQPEIPVSEISDDPLGDVIDAVTTPEVEKQPKQAAPRLKPENTQATTTEAVQKRVAQEPVKAETTPDTVSGKGAAATSNEKKYRVQLGAYASKKSASREWRRVKAKFAARLGDKAADFESVETGGRTLYRLRVGPYTDRITADQVCLALRADEQACIVVNP
jgi:cell division septation protein DedD